MLKREKCHRGIHSRPVSSRNASGVLALILKRAAGTLRPLHRGLQMRYQAVLDCHGPHRPILWVESPKGSIDKPAQLFAALLLELDQGPDQMRDVGRPS